MYIYFVNRQNKIRKLGKKDISSIFFPYYCLNILDKFSLDVLRVRSYYLTHYHYIKSAKIKRLTFI